MEPVEAPPVAPPLVGLIASSRVVDEGTERWGNGFEFAPEGCGAGGAFDRCNPGTKTIAANPGIVKVEPFGVWAGDKCSAFGFEARDYVGRARRLLEASESKQIEREFWRGTIARAGAYATPYLAENGAEVVGNGMTPANALACLEQALADGGLGRGMIHATWQLVTIWASNNLVTREGNRIMTVLGTLVVAGSGYDGSGPAAAPGGAPVAAGAAQWAYATGMVEIRRSTIDVIPGNFEEARERAAAMDIALNNIEMRAERLVGYAWDGCVRAAAEVALGICA